MLVLALIACDPLALAANDSLKPDLYFDTQFAMSTSKSKLVNSNDTGTALRYGAGMFAGNNKNLELLLMRESDTTTFALNDSSMQMAWQDTTFRYHLGFFYLAGIFTQVESKIKSQGVELVDAAGSGMGGGLGAIFAVGRGGSFHVDLSGVTVSSMKDALPQEIAIPSRIYVDVGGSLDLSAKLFDLTFGYRMRLLSIKTDTTYADTAYQTYVGVRCSWDF